MRFCPIICAVLLASCGPKPPAVLSPIPADLLRPCAGYVGPAPVTEGDLVDAVAAEQRGRLLCNGRIEAIAGMVE